MENDSGSIPICEYCGEEQCYFEHLLWGAMQHTSHRTHRGIGYGGREGQPQHKCLRNTGNVAKGFVQRPISIEMKETEEPLEEGKRAEQTERTKKVYTDGGCIKVPGGPVQDMGSIGENETESARTNSPEGGGTSASGSPPYDGRTNPRGMGQQVHG